MAEVPSVLVIDDDALVRELVERRLRSRGIAVETATDGEAGLAAARSIRPAVIVLDMMMPVMNGRQVLQEIRQDPALADIPVVMLTARNQEGDIVDALRLGATDYVVKPFSTEELAARIARLLPRRDEDSAKSGPSDPARRTA